MSRETGKLRTAAKRQARAPKKGERQLERDALILDSKAASLTLGSTLQSKLLNQQESKDIKDSVDQLQLEAERLRIIAANPHKTRSIPLDTVDETHKMKQVVGLGALIPNHIMTFHQALHLPILFLRKAQCRCSTHHAVG